MTTETVKPIVSCYSCQKPLDLAPEAKIGKSEECPYCFASLRCCKMCGFFDPKSYNECREPSAERIVEKEKANFCDFFSLSNSSQGGGSDKEDLLAAAKALFKD